MKLGGTVDAYVRPRWARWLRELSEAGFTADHLRTDPGNRDSAPRGAFRNWLQQQSTISAERAFFVGQRAAVDANLKHHGDGLLALYAAGYLSVAANCLQATIDHALERYPNRSQVARSGNLPEISQGISRAPIRPAPVRELNAALVVAVHLPFAMAHVDGIDDALISPQDRAQGLAAVQHWHDDGPVSMTLNATWAACVPEGSALQMPAEADETLADQQALTYSNFLNRLSRRAQHDPILQLHFSRLRGADQNDQDAPALTVENYQRAVFHVPHHQPKR